MQDFRRAVCVQHVLQALAAQVWEGNLWDDVLQKMIYMKNDSVCYNDVQGKVSLGHTAACKGKHVKRQKEATP